MADSLRILLVAHGYPPRENAGTEQHVAALARGLGARGHAVHVLAATRAPGRRQYARIEEPGITRIVNNIAARPLSQAERDPALEALVAAAAARLRPDVVHIHHLQFLSSGLTFSAPVVLTLHDAWLWCAAGGLLLDPTGSPCPGPEPSRCAPCAAAWRPRPGAMERTLYAAAGALAPWVAPDRLHALYQRLPARWRLPVRRGAAGTETAGAAAARNASMRAAGRAAAVRIAPSRALAALAEAQGLGPVRVLAHGVPPASVPRTGGGPLLFLGTIGRHKGTDLVVSAWKMAFPSGDPPLVLHGPVLEPEAAAGHPLAGPLDRDGVARALSTARALVLGSRWPENAPLVVLEARAAGCPVVAPAIGGLPELIEPGRDGLLYRPGDVAALAGALLEVVRSPPGPPRPPPSMDDHITAIEAVYREVMEPRCA